MKTATQVVGEVTRLARAEQLTVKKICEVAAWDARLLERATAQYSQQIFPVPGVLNALQLAVGRAQQRQLTRWPAQGQRVRVQLDLVPRRGDGEYVMAYDGRQPRLVKSWTFQRLPRRSDEIILTAAGGEPIRIRVSGVELAIEPRVRAAVPERWWAELMSRGFELRWAS